MQPGFSIVLETDCSYSIIHEKISQWAGSWLNFEKVEDGNRYSIVSENGVTGVSQKTVILCKELDSMNAISGIDSGQVLLLESALLTIDDDIENPGLGVPAYPNLRPSSLFFELLKEGQWFRNGLNISNKAKMIGFDDVDEIWKTIEDSSERLPQVIIGWGGRGNLPSVNPDIISTILCGFADVYVPARGAAMESMNSKMGKLGVPSGAVRVFTSNPSIISRQPLYTDERIRTRPNGRQFELDIFLRLAKLTLRENRLRYISQVKSILPENELDIVEEVEPVSENADFERIKNLNHEIIKMNDSLEDENDSLRIEKEDAFSEIESLNDEIVQHKLMIESYKDKIMTDKQKIKDMNAYNEQIKSLGPYMRQIIEEEELGDIEELINYLQYLREEDFEEEVEPIVDEYDSIFGVLQYLNTNKSDIFVINQSAFRSAKLHNAFRYPRRIMEAFEMMESSFPTLRSTAGKKKKLDYMKIFRQNGDFAVANRESKVTMEQFGDYRKFMHGGKSTIMGAHIKIGTGSDDECARIHFKFDKEVGKILIGHCGLHLPTVSGR